MPLRALLLTAAVVGLGGCQSTAPSYYISPGGERRVLDARASVYVALASDGEDIRFLNYEGSGRWTTHSIASALPNAEVTTGVREESLAQAVASARRLGSQYVVYPRILLWEDRAGETTGLPDRVAIQILLVEAAGGESVDRRIVEATGRTYGWRAGHPQDLIEGAVRTWTTAVVSQPPRVAPAPDSESALQAP
jgi:Domain of unknown function (DUF4823)